MTLGRPRSRGGLGGSPGRRRRGALVALLTLAVVLVTSGPAGAHTRLRSSDPSAGSVVATAPTAVTLRFAEPVAAADGAAHVYDDHYERVDEGQVLAVEGTSDSLRIPLRPGLAKGTYVVVWQASCHGYYRSPSGRIVTQWPYSMTEFQRRTAVIDPAAFEVD